MIFSSPLFLFAFLPIVIVSYYLMPPWAKNTFLLLASLIFYAWGEPFYVVLLVASITGNYLFGLSLAQVKTASGRQGVVLLAVAANIAFLAYFKYFNFALENLFFNNSSKVTLEQYAPDHLPLGISFFTFQALSYVIDVYRRTSPAQRNPLSLALFISSFPQMIAGPIIRYSDVQQQIEKRLHNAPLFVSGVRRFVYGLAKKVLIADTLGITADAVFSSDPSSLSATAVWFGILCFGLQIYFDFSAYSDMAIGLGRMFGFKFKENFNYPFIAKSVTEFWDRWHISLGSWFRDYLYIPLGGNRNGIARTYLNLWTVFLLCGLWHGASWNFVIWGGLFGFFLVIERLGLDRVLKSTWTPVQHLYLILIYLLTLIFFRVAEFPDAVTFLAIMLGVGDQGSLSWLEFYTRGAVLTIILGVVISTPFYPWLCRKVIPLLHQNSPQHMLCQFILIFGLLLVSVMGIATNAYTPFIYFRF